MEKILKVLKYKGIILMGIFIPATLWITHKRNLSPFKGGLRGVFFIVFSVWGICSGYAQMGIGTTAPHASAQLEVSSTTKGVLVPRMDSAHMVAIANPADGLLIYGTWSNSFWYKSPSQWVELLPSTETLKIQLSGCNANPAPKNIICIDTNSSKPKMFISVDGKWIKIN